MIQTVTLSGDVYRKLAQGASERGMTIESLLTIVSELVVLPAQPSEKDRHRSSQIEGLFDRFRAGQLSATDRAELNALIDADYLTAITRADEMIRAKPRRSRNGHAAGKKRTQK